MDRIEELIYQAGAVLTGVITFFACWLYAVTTYGFFLGVGLGWIPSLVIAFVAAIAWPLIALGLLILLVIALS